MKLLLPLLIFVASAAFALTPEERQVVLHAKSEIAAYKVEHAQAQAEATLLKQSAKDSAKSAAAASETAVMTGEKLTIAEGQVKAERKKLQTAVNEVARLKKIVDQVTGPWYLPGLKAVGYGIKLMLKRLFLLTGIAILLFAGLAIASALGVPGLGFALSLAKSAGGLASSAASKLVKKKKIQ